ncbi:MAG TPA: DinB family protein [Cytophagaceae bacterium]
MLQGEYAHAGFLNAVKNIPEEIINQRPINHPYNIWQLAEHIRITQWDIIEFCTNPAHISPEWPKEYWPKQTEAESYTQFLTSVKSFMEDRERFINHLSDPANDLFQPFSHGDGQNLLREAILIIDHTAYHTGQIILLRKIFNQW